MIYILPTRVCVRDPAFKNDPSAIYCGRSVPRAKDPRCRTNAPFRNVFVVRSGKEKRCDPIYGYHADAAALFCGWQHWKPHEPSDGPLIRVDSLETALNAYSLLLDMSVRDESAYGSASGQRGLTLLRSFSAKKLGCWCRIGQPCHVDRIIDAFRFWVLSVPFDETTMREWYTWGSRR